MNVNVINNINGVTFPVIALMSDPRKICQLRQGPVTVPLLTQQAANPYLDTVLQVHRRKMQRRQANRKSAQLSRARKKAHLDELKDENSKLQRAIDILESQPEFIFSFTKEGRITYLPERVSMLIRSAADDPDEEITSVNQILLPDSVEGLMESLNDLPSRDAKPQSPTLVKEVYYHDSTGFPVSGFMRCTRLVRKSPLSKRENDDHSESESEKGQQKRSRKESTSGESATSKENSTSSTGSKTSRSGSLADYETGNRCQDACDDHEEREDEFVCVIRPASVSSPYGLYNLHLLSAASMVAHDSQQRGRGGVQDNAERRDRNQCPSDGSSSGGQPKSSLSTEQTKNSTSSEADSIEDNSSTDL